mmetsp:Transcript_14089/g.34136  ORF Transcript_14089/g.34136 Transcript_14089/m.34136 type:complete len:100 (+) Transcript_14089:336-635(+)
MLGPDRVAGCISSVLSKTRSPTEPKVTARPSGFNSELSANLKLERRGDFRSEETEICFGFMSLLPLLLFCSAMIKDPMEIEEASSLVAEEASQSHLEKR